MDLLFGWLEVGGRQLNSGELFRIIICLIFRPSLQ
jgi:hypothetical protein